MSRLVKPDEVEDLEFKWGKKRGVGGKKKEVQFYESFTYDGVEYTLHDSVYMHKEGEPDPYIGKIVKIWGNPDKSKKVKIQWFFRPLEISGWIRDIEVLENEIFFASGEGVGLANVNPLEAIAGKCNVVCISKDHRNPQPSVEELQMADYVFYRTFDVGNCTISNVLEDKVGGLESKFLFNRRENENAISVSKVESEGKEDNRNAVACNETVQISLQNKRDNLGGNCNQPMVRADAKAKDLLVKQETSTGERPASGAIVYSSEVPMTSVESRSVSGGKTTRHQVDSSKDKVYDVNVEERIKSVKASDGLDDRPSKKARVDIGIKLSDANNMKRVRKSVVLGNDDVKGVVEKKVKIGHGKDFYRLDQGVKTAQDSVAFNDRPAKKTGVGSSVKLSEDKNKKSVEKLIINYDPNEPKDLVTVAASSDGKLKSRLAKDSLGLVKGPPKKEKPDEKSSKLSNGKLPKVSADEDRITVGQILEVTRKPDADKSKWFRALPWEERMKNAHEKGTMALLQNLDPTYTSGEVEDIIWRAFNENCSAKMVPRTTISSPHSGQAFIIFRTREATERVIKKLDDGCLMLSNGRPLVGCFGPPSLSGKQPTFFGHLFVDKFKLQMQREMKEAVSTSHCSQPNTIEYEMAMEWCLLQSRSDNWWKSLHKQQGQDLRKLMANLKSK